MISIDDDLFAELLKYVEGALPVHKRVGGAEHRDSLIKRLKLAKNPPKPLRPSDEEVAEKAVHTALAFVVTGLRSIISTHQLDGLKKLVSISSVEYASNIAAAEILGEEVIPEQWPLIGAVPKHHIRRAIEEAVPKWNGKIIFDNIELAIEGFTEEERASWVEAELYFNQLRE
jgi:hypothetical protein